ncbi:FkbM family methyltransferase [Jhaorihella thermophila]
MPGRSDRQRGGGAISHQLTNTTIIRRDRLHQLKERERGYFDLQFIKAIDRAHRNDCIDLLDRSRSQARQDLFALAQLDFLKGGYFVDFNAGDGVECSNTWLMEKDFDWTGILAEPAPKWHDALRRNRNCIIDTRSVWSESGGMQEIAETPAPRERPGHAPARPGGIRHEVETVSLNDLLQEHGAPEVIDYLSMDTGGTELEILDAVDFDRWSFRVLTVEHNYTPQREEVRALLSAHGYRRVMEEVSRFDDWYVKDS